MFLALSQAHKLPQPTSIHTLTYAVRASGLEYSLFKAQPFILDD